ncbi:MAG: hypothetical protein ACO3JF_02275 [Ilumatobacteraceae bacterium]
MRSGNKGMMAALVLVVIIPLIVILVMMLRPSSTTYSFVISPGTQNAIDNGEKVPNQLPRSLDLKVGDTLEVTNNDSVAHTYTFLILRPGETGKYTFHNAGVFTAACTVGEHKEVSITVRE